MEFTLSNLTGLAEIIGAVAVIVSLVFVSIQLRENARATRSATATAVSTAAAQWYWIVGGDSQATGVLMRFLANGDKSPKEEQYQAMMLLHGNTLLMQNNYYLAQQGTLEGKIQHTFQAALIGVKDAPGWRHYWSLRRGAFLPEFKAFVEDTVANDARVIEPIY